MPEPKVLRVAEFIGTRAGDAERGPQVRINDRDASARFLVDGELAWVETPRRKELATVKIDPQMPHGDVGLRDVAGAAPSELVRVVKPDLDGHVRRGIFG